jgi:hypothetical protein
LITADGEDLIPEVPLEFLAFTENLIALSVGFRKLESTSRRRTERGAGWGLLARRFFSGAEKEYLFSQELESQKACFFRIFTLKEARAKAQGGKASVLPSPGLRFPCLPTGTQPGARGNLPADTCFRGCSLVPCGGEFHTGIPSAYRFWEWNEPSFEKDLERGEGFQENDF